MSLANLFAVDDDPSKVCGELAVGLRYYLCKNCFFLQKKGLLTLTVWWWCDFLWSLTNIFFCSSKILKRNEWVCVCEYCDGQVLVEVVVRYYLCKKRQTFENGVSEFLARFFLIDVS